MTTQYPTYFTENKKRVTVYSRFNITEKIEPVEMVNLGPVSMELGSVKRLMFNERIGDWMLMHKTKSTKKVKEAIKVNFQEILKAL